MYMHQMGHTLPPTNPSHNNGGGGSGTPYSPEGTLAHINGEMKSFPKSFPNVSPARWDLLSDAQKKEIIQKQTPMGSGAPISTDDLDDAEMSDDEYYHHHHDDDHGHNYHGHENDKYL